MTIERDCIFCKIIKKEEPAMIVYEDDLSIVFLAALAITDGHLLVIPKQHRVTILDLEEAELNDIMKTTKIISKRLIEKLGAGGVNLLNASGKAAQQSVLHFHLHIVPRFENDNLDLWFGKFDGYLDGRKEHILDLLAI